MRTWAYRLILPTLVIIAAILYFTFGKSSSSTAGPAYDYSITIPSSLPGELTGPAPWGPNNGPTLRPRLQALGLPALSQEALALHIHQHLDLFVDGKRVTVPAEIGIDEAQGFLTVLHTHDSSGVMHVESPTQRTFTLGEFMGVWGLRLTPDCLGRYCAGGGRELKVWVDGHPVTGNPANVTLREHEEIAIAYGTPSQMPSPVPSSYTFPAGD